MNNKEQSTVDILFKALVTIVAIPIGIMAGLIKAVSKMKF